MTVGPPYWVEVLTKGGREIIWTTLPDKQVGYFCLPGLIPVGRYIPITPDSKGLTHLMVKREVKELVPTFRLVMFK